nr:MAG TPA: hypothetical protein [Caudoviricetes sp.]
MFTLYLLPIVGRVIPLDLISSRMIFEASS